MLIKFWLKFGHAIFKFLVLKAVIKTVLAGNAIAMVTYCATKIVSTWSPMIAQFLDTMVRHQVIKRCYNTPSNSNCWKLLWPMYTWRNGLYPLSEGARPFNRCWTSNCSHTSLPASITLSTTLHRCYFNRDDRRLGNWTRANSQNSFITLSSPTKYFYNAATLCKTIITDQQCRMDMAM